MVGYANDKQGWIKDFVFSPRNLFLLGFILVTALSLSEMLRGRQANFFIFAEATKLFWQQIAPYGQTWAQAAPHLDHFLYGPLFNLLFTPFAFMPSWLGSLAWNLFNFTLWFTAIFTLPARFTREEKCKSFLFTLLILACTQLSFQYNVTVGSIFLLAFSLLERDKAFWAILLIMISGLSKIYGIFELGLLVCYPHLLRNIGYTLLITLLLIAAPVINIPAAKLPAYYGEWFEALVSHCDSRTWMTIFYLRPLNLLRWEVYIQIGVLVALAGGLLANFRHYANAYFRTAALAVLMGYVIFFGSSSEGHTYVITLIGYQLWYWSMHRAGALTRLDKGLFWAILVVCVVMPVDVICPSSIMRIFYGWQVNLWLIAVMWFRMVYTTFIRIPPQLRRV